MKNAVLFLVFSLLCLGKSTAQKNLTLLDSIQYPGQRLSGCWHYNDPLGHEYALVGAEHGIVIADITNPTNIFSLFQLPGVSSIWHEVKVIGDYAYAVCAQIDSNSNILNGLQIIDLRYLPDSAPYKIYQGDGAILNLLEASHSITAAGHYVYLNGHNIISLGRGVLILDISDPWNPVYTGAITARYCHDSYVRGDTIYTSDILDGMFTIYDITNRAFPVELATQQTPYNFNHNTWLSDDGNFLFATDEKVNAPLTAYDVHDFLNISMIDTFYNGYFSSSEVHNVRVFNDFLLNPSYGSQLTIADAARPSNIIETGHYITGNSLCWDADPYPASGNIIATDENSYTLYLFQPNYVRACYLEGLITDSMTGQPLINASVSFQGLSIFCLADLVGKYETGYADSGLYNVTYSKSGYVSKTLNVHLQNGVLNTLNVQLVDTASIGIPENDYPEIEVVQVRNEFFKVKTNGIPIDSWSLTDVSGRLINSDSHLNRFSGEFNIDVCQLRTGVYFLRLNWNGKVILKKITKS